MMKFLYFIFLLILNLIGFDLYAQVAVADDPNRHVCREPGGYAQEEADTNRVYSYVGQWPQFPGWDENSEFKTRDIRYPSDSARPTEEEKKAMVIVGFTVEKNGTLSDPKILKSTAPAFDEDAVRIVSSMPKWLPGKNNGVAVRCRSKITVIYHPSQKN